MCTYVLVDGDMLCAHVSVHVCEGPVSLNINQSVSSGVDVPNIWKEDSAPPPPNKQLKGGLGQGKEWQPPPPPHTQVGIKI